MDFIIDELGVPRKYLKNTNRDERLLAVVHRTWLRSLLKYNHLIKFIQNEQYESWPYDDDDLGSSWVKIFITVYKKSDEKVIPLPRIRSVLNRKNCHLSYFQLLHYVMQSNHKNLWKDAFKKFTAPYSNKSNDSHITLTDYNVVLREIITRAYGCPLINTLDANLSMGHSKYFEPHRNVLSAACAIETLNCIFLIHAPHVTHTLQDCVMFSPAILDNCYTKPLFIIYQLLQTLLTMHDRSLTIGDITLNDIYITDNLWIHILPRLNSNLHVQEATTEKSATTLQMQLPLSLQLHPNVDCRQTGHVNDPSLRCCIYCGKKVYDKVTLTGDESVSQLCEYWVRGLISNFTYLSALNELSGRRYGEPNNHHVMPWVTDFSSRCGNNWRDLTKSKFRLNKGDRQLDLTYDNSSQTNQVAHHVSDVLSSITYYVYMARRTPRSVLCKNVRTIWVPAEYPSSIQRLQEWTPDECIPEFFTDAAVFKSIHEDLNDLEVPPWSSSPEDFIEKHREALESLYVSEKLHHWIDLTFGYKLSGSAAVKSKNVCLHLVDGHKCLKDSGVVQLFTQPHPARNCSTAFTGKTPPKIHTIRSKRREPSSCSLSTETQRQSEDEDISSGIDDDTAASASGYTNRSPLVLSRLLSRSRSSLNNSDDNTKETAITSSSTITASSSSSSAAAAVAAAAVLSSSVVQQTTASNVAVQSKIIGHKLSPNLGPKYPTFTSHVQNVKNTSTPITSAATASATIAAGGSSNLNTSTSSSGTSNTAGNTATNLHLISVQKSCMQSGVIHLPKEFNPMAALNAIELQQNFLEKTFHSHTKLTTHQNVTNNRQKQQQHSIPVIANKPNESNVNLINKENIQQHQQNYLNSSNNNNINISQDDSENSFTNKIFTENFEASLRKDAVKLSRTLKSSNSFPTTADLKLINATATGSSCSNNNNISTSSTGSSVNKRSKRKSELYQSNCNYKQIVATCRMRELQIVGCLIVELFLAKQMRAQGTHFKHFADRLRTCLSVLKCHGDSLPRCVKYAVNLLLQINNNEETDDNDNYNNNNNNFVSDDVNSDFNDNVPVIRYPSVTEIGLPPPSAHQLLQPLLSCIFPFPNNFHQLYDFLGTLQEYSNISNELNILYHFDCDGESCAKYENIERTKILFAQNIGECKVKYCAKQLEIILFGASNNNNGSNRATTTSTLINQSSGCCFGCCCGSTEQTVNLVLPYVKEIIEDPATSILAAWYLFEPISRALGPVRSAEHLLPSLLQLYDENNEQFDDTNSMIAFNWCKVAKLYHHSFLLCLIVRLGLKTFLDNFITPLVEAVGGYKDYDRPDIMLHNHVQRHQLVRKTSNLKRIDNAATAAATASTSSAGAGENCGTGDGGDSDISVIISTSASGGGVTASGDLDNLSPLDEESSGDSEKLVASPCAESIQDVENEPEVFEFENEDDKQTIQNLEKNLSKIELDFNHSIAEEALEESGNQQQHQEHQQQQQSKQQSHYEDDEEYEYVFSTCPKSPTIPIPSSYRQSELITIGCDVGSKKSENETTMDKQQINPSTSNTTTVTTTPTVTTTTTTTAASCSTSNWKTSLDDNRKMSKKRNNFKISDMSADSLIWLSHRLGPVLTARYLSRNLLRMLTLCYVGKENLQAINTSQMSPLENIDSVSISNWRVTGDQNASKVLHCLVSIAALYGEQLILLQYLPHMSELISMCKRKLTPNLEGGLISCMALLKHIIPYLVDGTLMDQLQDEILKNIIHPTVRLLGTTKFVFPSGALARNVLARKYIDTLYVLSLRIGTEMSRTNLAVPALQRFFLIFNKVHGDFEAFISEPNKSSSLVESPVRSLGDHYIEVKRDGTTTEWAVRGRPFQISQLRVKDYDSSDSFSPPPVFRETSSPSSSGANTSATVVADSNSVAARAMDELKQVFTSELAHTAFVPFLHHLGTATMESSLKNHTLLRELCFEYEQVTIPPPQSSMSIPIHHQQQPHDFTDNDQIDTVVVGSTGSFGSNVALVGNRIDVAAAGNNIGGSNSSIVTATTSSNNSNATARQQAHAHILNLVSNKIENTNRHLRQNWLAYWEHEIGRGDKDTMFYFKQIKLQSFHGHTNTVKAIQPLDNENSFMSASKDKTVKLWSLRSQGDGTAISQCQSTYTCHKKSVLSVAFVESLRLAASCDSVVHIWDPFLSAVVAQLEGPRTVPVSLLRPMPAPSTTLLAATDSSVRFVDVRTCSYVHELKVSTNPVGLVRCMAVSSSGHWIAVGQSSGHVTILDTRTGLLLASWRAHDGELLQLAPAGEHALVTSGLDQTVSVWHVPDGKLKFHMNLTFTRGATEPVHCLQVYNNELISGTTANRIGVHTSIDVDASFSSTRLRSDTFKGVLTTMALLPLNRLLLLGADSGNISLLC